MSNLSEEEIIKRINCICNKWYDENLEIDVKWIQGLLDLYQKEKEVTSLQDKILKLLIEDMQLEGYFKDMKYESVIEYYKRRKDL